MTFPESISLNDIPPLDSIIDPFSGESLETIKNDKIASGNKFYICIGIKGNNKTYFDGNNAARYYLNYSTTKNNPFTNGSFDDFSIYKLSNNLLKRFCSSEELTTKHIFAYKIATQDPEITSEKLKECFKTIANLYYFGSGVPINMEKAEKWKLRYDHDDRKVL